MSRAGTLFKNIYVSLHLPFEDKGSILSLILNQHRPNNIAYSETKYSGLPHNVKGFGRLLGIVWESLHLE